MKFLLISVIIVLVIGVVSVFFLKSHNNSASQLTSAQNQTLQFGKYKGNPHISQP